MLFKDIVGGIFKESVLLPRKGFLLKHERERILALFLCVRRNKLGIPVEMEKELGIGMVLSTPQYGFDPVLMFQWFHTLHMKPPRCVRWDVDEEVVMPPLTRLCITTKNVRLVDLEYISGSAMAHRVMETAKWYPEDVDITIDGPMSIANFEKWLLGVFRRVKYMPTFQSNVLSIHTEVVRTGTTFEDMYTAFKTACVNEDVEVELCPDVTIEIPRVFGRDMPLFNHRIGIKWTCGNLVVNVIPKTQTTNLSTYDAQMCATHTITPFTTVYQTFDRDHGPFVFQVAPASVWNEYPIPGLLRGSLMRRASERFMKYMVRFPYLNCVDGDERMITSYGISVLRMLRRVKENGYGDVNLKRACSTKALVF